MKKLILAAVVAVTAPLAVAAPAANAATTDWELVKTYQMESNVPCAKDGQWYVRNHEARAYKCVKGRQHLSGQDYTIWNLYLR